jgi:hypothetical protein
MLRPRTRIPPVVAGVVTLAAAVTFVTHAWTGHAAPSAQPGDRLGAGVVPSDLPFPDAVYEPSMAAAEAALGWHIVRPEACAASDSSISTIYISPSSDQVQIVYADLTPQSGCSPDAQAGHLQLLEERPTSGQGTGTVGAGATATPPDPSEVAQDEASSLGPVASVATVDGQPAVVITGDYPGDCDATPAPGQQGCIPADSHNPTSVSFQLSDLSVQLIGDPTWPTSFVESIGNTVG